MTRPKVLPEAPPRPGQLVFQHTWPSRIDFKDEMVQSVLKVMTSRHWLTEEDAMWMQMVLEEVFVNAIIHGNEGEPTLDVDCDIRVDADRWVLIICDRGTGFDPTTLPDPDNPECLEYEHGRGLLLMISWLDELIYYNSGATAYLTRTIAAQSSSKTDKDGKEDM